ncbi:uncharacterized protein LOC129835469 [Salvelinus fontinalis]|uniref:uncharacterized protein LOC129835469 n=1 Tax=Salvelinus fontinalis TaxID=8038 RepID=UPI0024860BCF|nr:uncharacterized protein LOC129835469 [Salvelinus fontinalis]
MKSPQPQTTNQDPQQEQGSTQGQAPDTVYTCLHDATEASAAGPSHVTYGQIQLKKLDKKKKAAAGPVDVTYAEVDLQKKNKAKKKRDSTEQVGQEKETATPSETESVCSLVKPYTVPETATPPEADSVYCHVKPRTAPGIGEKKGIAAASLVGIIVGIVTGGLFLVGVGCIISTRRHRSPKEILPLKAVVPEVYNPVSTIPGRPELQNTPGSEVTSIYITAGRPELQNTPGSEVTSIYITAGRPGAVPAAAGGEEGHPVDKEYTSPEERKEPQSSPQADTFYSTLQIPAAAQHHPVGKGNNLKKPDTVYWTKGDKLPD